MNLLDYLKIVKAKKARENHLREWQKKQAEDLVISTGTILKNAIRSYGSAGKLTL